MRLFSNKNEWHKQKRWYHITSILRYLQQANSQSLVNRHGQTGQNLIGIELSMKWWKSSAERQWRRHNETIPNATDLLNQPWLRWKISYLYYIFYYNKRTGLNNANPVDILCLLKSSGFFFFSPWEFSINDFLHSY